MEPDRGLAEPNRPSPGVSFVDMNRNGSGTGFVQDHREAPDQAKMARVRARTALWHRLFSGVAPSRSRDVLHRLPAHACHVRRHHHPASHRRGGARPAPGRNVVLRERGALRLWHLYHHAGDARRARWDRAPLGAGNVVHFRWPCAGRRRSRRYPVDARHEHPRRAAGDHPLVRSRFRAASLCADRHRHVGHDDRFLAYPRRHDEFRRWRRCEGLRERA